MRATRHAGQVRDEIRMTMAAYQTLYESSVAFGMRKALQVRPASLPSPPNLESVGRSNAGSSTGPAVLRRRGILLGLARLGRQPCVSQAGFSSHFAQPCAPAHPELPGPAAAQPSRLPGPCPKMEAQTRRRSWCRS